MKSIKNVTPEELIKLIDVLPQDILKGIKMPNIDSPRDEDDAKDQDSRDEVKDYKEANERDTNERYY